MAIFETKYDAGNKIYKITKEDKANLKRAAKALAAESTDKVKADAEELATLMNEIGL